MSAYDGGELSLGYCCSIVELVACVVDFSAPLRAIVATYLFDYCGKIGDSGVIGVVGVIN
jgi:hypothetical protein